MVNHKDDFIRKEDTRSRAAHCDSCASELRREASSLRTGGEQDPRRPQAPLCRWHEASQGHWECYISWAAGKEAGRDGLYCTFRP